MKRTLTNQSKRILFDRVAYPLILAIVFLTPRSWAAPRAPGPPMPELPPLYHESFDEDYFVGETNSQLFVSGLGIFDESWSGYALDRKPESVAPFVVPALASIGRARISSDTGGAFRWWVKPGWSSQSQTNGSGPGTIATLLEFDAVNGNDAAFVWSLRISADGNALELLSQTETGLQVVLQSQLTWVAGTSYCVVLDYTRDGTVLYVDGITTVRILVAEH